MTAPVQPTNTDRLLTSLRLILRAEIPELNFLGTYEYSVQSSSGTTVDASPVDTTIPLPSITNMPVFPSVLGESITGIQTGQLCLVQFVNGDPTRPEVIGLSEINQTATVDATGTLTVGSAQTVSVALAAGTAPVARQGDQINIPMPTAPVAVSGVLNPGALNFVGTIGPLPPATGIITGSNPKVTA